MNIAAADAVFGIFGMSRTENTMIVLGFDPGLKGAIALIDGDRAIVEDMPVADGSVDADGLADTLSKWIDGHQGKVVAYVERVGAMPKQGVSSTFKFGTGYGEVLGVLAGLKIPRHKVTPQTWKKSYRLGNDKEQSRARALELFPSLAGDLKRKKDEGRAEALLLALYGKTQERGDQ